MATDSKGNALKIGDVLATDPITIIVAKIENGCIYLAREGWEKRMLPNEAEHNMLVKLTQKEMTNSHWIKTNGVSCEPQK